MDRSHLFGLLPVLVLTLTACSRHTSTPGVSPARPLSLSFETRTEIDVGADRVADVVSDDFNGDQVLDLAVSSLDGTIEILFGQGNGAFTNVQSLPASGFSFNVKSAQLDDMGGPELVVLRSADRMLEVFHNDQGTFTSVQEIPVEADPDSIAIGDCTGDGVVDIAVSHWHPSSSTVRADVSVFHGIRRGTFNPQRTVAHMPNQGISSGVRMFDANRDGIQDLLVGDKLRGELVVLQSQGVGYFTVAAQIPTGACPNNVEIGDFDGDGVPEVVVSNYEDRSLTVMAGPLPPWIPVEFRPLPGLPGRLLVADFNADGVDDLCVTTIDEAFVWIAYGEARAGLGPLTALATTGLPFRSVAGDFDGDGDLDLIASGTGTSVLNYFPNDGRGPRASFHLDPGVAGPGAVASGDLNNDGCDEIAVVGVNGNEVAIVGLPPGNPDFRAIQQFGPPIDVGQRLLNVHSGDFDSDGSPDFAVTTTEGLKLLLNRTPTGAGVATFEIVPPDPSAVIIPGAGLLGVAGADMDGDGDVDVVAADFFLDQLTVALADGSGGYQVLAPVALGDTPGGLVAADFDGDGDQDIAVNRRQDAVVAFLRNDGAGNLEPWLDEPVGPNPNYLVTADFDRDGDPDLASSNGLADQVTVLWNNAGSFSAVQLDAGAVPTDLLAEDVDRDGAIDLTVVSLRGGDFRTFFGDGNGGFTAPIRFAGTYKAGSATFGDIDGDELSELIIAGVESQQLSVYRNTSVTQ